MSELALSVTPIACLIVAGSVGYFIGRLVGMSDEVQRFKVYRRNCIKDCCKIMGKPYRPEEWE